MTTAELAAFLAEVLELEAGKRGDLQFEPMEPHLVLKLRGELGGRVEVSGVAFDEPEGVNALAFNWLMEGKQLKPLIKQLKDALKDFPAR